MSHHRSISLACLGAVLLCARVAQSQDPTNSGTEAGSPTDVVEDSGDYGATAEVEAPPRETTRRSVDEKELKRVPGTRGDALRAVELLPGVARPPSGYGNPILRGAAASDSQTFLDGAPVPFLYHFGGVTSFFNSQLIEGVDLYPGNFSARFGRLSGGVVEVRARDPKLDALHGLVDLNLIDSSALVEGPVDSSGNTGVAVAVRRSNIDFFFKNFVPKSAYAVMAAPVYYDVQLLGVRRMGRSTLRLLGYGSRDSLELFFAEPNQGDPGLTGKVGGLIEFERAAVSLETELSQSATQTLSVTVGNLSLEQHVGPFEQQISGPEVFARAEWGVELGPELRVTAGGDFSGWFAGGRYRGPLPGALEGDPHQNDPLATQTVVGLRKDDIDVVRPGAYVELAIRPTPRVTILPSLRADYYGDLHDVTLDPRLSTRAQVGPTTTLKSGVGIYSQPPEYWQALDVIGNPRLEAFHALHTSTGIEQRLGLNTSVSVEGFYKWLWHRPVLTPDGGPPRYVNDGVGRIYGAELGVETRPTQETFAYLAYTLSRSERRDDNQAWRRFDFDETQVLSLAVSEDLGRGWSTGARFRWVSGAPYTPVVASVYDARTDTYVPRYGATNSAQNPAFHQLDLRVEKAWHIGSGTLAAYLDLQNAYNAKNVEAVEYSYDYRAHRAVTGLPILPNLGLRGEL